MKRITTTLLLLAAFAAAPAAIFAQEETPVAAAPAATADEPAVAPNDAAAAETAPVAAEAAAEAAAETVASATEPAVEAVATEAASVAEQVAGQAAATPAGESEAAETKEVVDEQVAEVDNSAATEPEKHWVRREAVVNIGGDGHLKADERTDAVVVIFGNAVVEGKVDDAVVVIGGHAKINGPVDQVVLVMADGELGPNASVRSDAVVVAGNLANPHGVRIGGTNVSVEKVLPQLGEAPRWFTQGVIKGRPMVPSLRMSWIVAGAFLAFYLFLALILGRAVNATAATLENRPGGTLLAALLFLPAFPLFMLLLTATGIGLLLVPFLMIGVFFAALFGKVAFLAFVGRAILRPAGEGPMGIAVLTTLVGGVVVTLLYGIWYLGFALWALTSWIGIGMVIMTIITALKRERPKPAPVAPASPAPAPAAAIAPAAPAAPTAAAAVAGGISLSAPAASGLAGGEPAASAGFVAEPPPAVQPPPQVPPVQPAVAPVAVPTSAVGYERANFGIRLAAILIDIVLVAVVFGSIGAGNVFPVFLGVYCALLWFYRGTSVGGIICGLKVVRLDGRPVDIATAIVRTLGAYLSLVCVGVGFLWVIWDPEKQSWHDKIAGTTVIRVPKGMSLV